MTEKPTKAREKSRRTESRDTTGKGGHEGRPGLAERSTTEHHIPGADGPSGAGAEADNNP